ncbi:hypothetical protein SLE2022_112070 [Rubroshorea leprosula]
MDFRHSPSPPPSPPRSFFSESRPSPLPLSRFKPCSCRCSSDSLEQTLSPIHHTFSLIQDSAVIACLRANSADLAMEAARAALAGGISVMEIVRSTPGVFEVLQRLVQEYPTNAFGVMVGTVLNSRDARRAIDSGAKFLMSPVTVKDIMKDVQDSDVLYIPGAMTPTEIFSAYETGAKMVKIYPVSALGGIRYISALKKPFPHIPMVASQGVTIDSIQDYVAQGAISVVLSDSIFNKQAMAENNFNVIHELAQSATSQGRKAVGRTSVDSRSQKSTQKCLR